MLTLVQVALDYVQLCGVTRRSRGWGWVCSTLSHGAFRMPPPRLRSAPADLCKTIHKSSRCNYTLLSCLRW